MTWDNRSALLYPGVNLTDPNIIVNKAYLTFIFDYSWGVGDTGNHINVWISGGEAPQQGWPPDAPYLPTTPASLEGLSRTTNKAHWNEDLGQISQGHNFQSPDFSCVIQELIDKGGVENLVLYVESYLVENEEWDFEEIPETVWCDEPATLDIYYSYAFNETAADGGVAAGGSADVWTPWSQRIVSDAIDNTGLNRATHNMDNYLFIDIQLEVGGTFDASDRVDVYMICERLDQDGTSFEEGSVSIAPPPANYLGSFVLNTESNQTHVLRQIPIPPLMFKLLMVNETSAAINTYSLKVRPYRFQWTKNSG